MEREVAFITFGGPTPVFHRRVRELCAQAELLHGFFTTIRGFTEADLMADPEFWTSHGNFIETNRRGYGYWLWKPHIIKKMMDKMKENDVLIYADAGCHLNLTQPAINRLYEYVSILDGSPLGILSFQMEHLEYKYTKRETIDAVFEKDENTPHTTTGQCMATAVILRKTPHSVQVVDEWARLSQIYSIVNDDKHKERRPEVSGFIDHRHDQSILSLLVKKYGSVKIPDETYFAPNWTKDGHNYPIWAVRDKW
jgi:hypothetical protein